MVFLFIDYRLKMALWNGQQITVEIAECLINQYSILKYDVSCRENDEKKTRLYMIRKGA